LLKAAIRDSILGVNAGQVSLGEMVVGFQVLRKTGKLAFILMLLAAGSSRAAPELRVTFDPVVSKSPFTGRVYLFLSPREMSAPPAGPSWFKPDPFYARDVVNWKPGETLILDDSALGFPVSLGKVPRATYWALAVMDLQRSERSFSLAAGNGYSKAVRVQMDSAAQATANLKIDQVVQPRRFVDTERVKLVDIESKLLSAFHTRSVHLRAAVILPKSYADNLQKHYPVIYEIPGFGGNHFMAKALAERDVTDVAGTEMLYVVLDPSCPLGHHVFADSQNNGPCGRALVEELIPYIEKQYRALGVAAARFVTGHSSGGWSSLWLQVAYPDFFGAVWSTSPDPVDFRDFQRINIYKPGANLFIDEKGQPRPLARLQGKPVLFFKPFSNMEVVMGHGGQLGSFEAVFSQRGPDGRPARLWDRTTGAIDPAVARCWEKYDSRLVLERNWRALGPRLAGKLHIYTGGEDTFYLEGAVALLKESLARLGSDAVIEIFPGRDHSSVMDRPLRQRIAKEMAESFRRSFSPGS